MKKVLILTLLLAFAGSFLGGCAGLGETTEANWNKKEMIFRSQNHMFWDDVDTFLLLDKSSSLTPEHFRVGD
jgi:hypothetical protein